MPATEVCFFKDDKSGTAPALVGLENLYKRNLSAYAKLRARIDLLEEKGHELRRPACDYLRDGIYELRAKDSNGQQHRILYFFHWRNCAILSHCCTKEKEVPLKEIDLAIMRKKLFSTNPDKYTYRDAE